MTAKILIVEDNIMNLELASDLLEANGFTVLRAGSGEEGITTAKSQQPDLILMDIALPGMDGLSATKILKEDPATWDIPIIALTAHAMNGDEEKALSIGCVGYITKPLNTREFAPTVSRFLETVGA